MPFKLLVTGFEPFGGAAINPSEDAVKALANHASLARQIRTMVLPVTYVGAAVLLTERMRVEDPDGVIAFGLSRSATALSIESQAENVCDSDAPDNAGVVRRAVPVIAGARERSFAGPVVDRLATMIASRGVPVQRSIDAGRFVCNATYFAALHHAKTRPVVFIHVPATRPIGGEITPETLQAWIVAAVESMLAVLASPVERQ